MAKPIPNWNNICTSVEQDGLRVDLEYIGEGYNGDYDPNDPEDEPLLRFTLIDVSDGDWNPVDDASYCTTISAYTTPIELRENVAKRILNAYLTSDRSKWKRLGEQLSYIDTKGD